MSILSSETILYHTSYTIIDCIDLSKCKSLNDFGRGFYLTTAKEQAIRFVNAAIRKGGRDVSHGYILAYEINNYGGLSAFEFEATDANWLHCICGYRRGIASVCKLWDGYDLIAGKVANDDTNATITFYLNGAYGEVGSNEAVAAALKQLRPEVLENQICMKTHPAIDRLQLIGYETVEKYG